MSELERQLRAYAETLDQSAPSVEELADRVDTSEPAHARSPMPRWVAVVGAAAVVVIAVGSVTVFSGLREPTEDTASTTIASTTAAPDADTDVTATSVPTGVLPSTYVELVSSEPAYAGGEDGDVGGLPKVDAGPVALHDGEYHTLFAAGGDDDVWDSVFHASSSDGSVWSVDPEPVVLPGIEGAAGLAIGSLDRLNTGTWVTYFHVAFDVGGHGNHIYEYAIRKASATSPDGPWTVDPEPMLLPGPEGSWDAGGVKFPSVIRTPDGWSMYYAGFAKGDKSVGIGGNAIGRAASVDGLVWTRTEEPVFTGTIESWEEGAVSRPSVAVAGNDFVLLYAGRTGGSRGLAVSDDGVVWRRVSGDPVLTSIDVPRPAIFTTSLLSDDGELRLYVSNGGYRTSSAVYEMRLELP